MTIGTIKEIKELQAELEIVERDIEALQRHKIDDRVSFLLQVKEDILDKIEKLNNKSFFCPTCGSKLNKEKRLYRGITSLDELGRDFFARWIVYNCENCGYFNWDENSKESVPTWEAWASKEKCHGNYYAHPKDDKDNTMTRRLPTIDKEIENEN